VLAVANAVLESQGQGARRLVATQDDGPLPTVTSYATDVDEARAVARWARRGQPSVPWRHVAVLARTNAQLLLFEQAFRAADVPYRVRGGPSFLQRPAVREALAELRRRSPGAAFSVLAPDLDEMARAAGDDDGPAPGPDAGAGRPKDGRPTTGREGSAREDLENLARLAREQLALDPAATLEGFLAWLVASLGRDDHQSDGDGVELATFHAAKGLEWPVVFLTGLERGLVPIAHAETPEARAEERRLLYVAVTRARHQLHCSWSERRTFGARTSSRAPSPYLDVVEAAVRALREAGRQREVALVGFDDFPLADVLEPALTVVRQDVARIGATVGDLLFSRLDGDTTEPRQVVIRPTLVARGSGELPAPPAGR
jgi:DNA helicase-2/ATP-dependent DNA helicase PcrA